MIVKRKKFLFLSLFILIIAVTIPIVLYQKKWASGEIGMLSLSSDGHYAISTDTKGFAILWDIQKKQKTIIDRHANLYSAYWIKNTPYFMWQNNDTKMVYVQSIDGSIVKKIPLSFLVVGEAMTEDLNYLIASNADWDIYLVSNGSTHLMARGYDDMDFEAANKPINFTFLNNNQVLTSGMGSAFADDPKDATGIFLWDLDTLKPLHDYIATETQTFATISPDGQYIVAGDNGGSAFLWNTKKGNQIFELDDLNFGTLNRHNSTDTNKWTWNAMGLLKKPNDFLTEEGLDNIDSVVSLKFIDATHYLRFTMGIPYAILYEVTNPKALKYISLGRHPYPSVDYYARDQAIDTSPSAHILVMGKENEGGILVYQYDPQTQTLTKVWDGE